MVTVSRKPAARRPAPAKSLPVKTRKAAEPAKPAPAARKAAPARPAAASKAETLAKARAAKAEKAAAAAPTKVHPVRKDKISAHDVVRAWHTALTLHAQYVAQEGQEAVEALEFVAPIMDSKPGVDKKTPLTRAKVEPEDRVIDEYYDKEIVEKYTIKELRELAGDLGLDEQKLKTKILAEMESKGFFREDGDSDADEDGVEDDVDEDAEGDDGEEEEELDDEESDDDSEDDDDETEERVYDRDDLKAMTLKELQELAEANEVNFKGLGKAELIETLLADDDDEEEDDSEDEEDEDDDAPVEIDPDELPNMDLDELLELCEQIDVKVPASKKKNKKAVIQLILDELEDEE
jgi:hypothetical protein